MATETSKSHNRTVINLTGVQLELPMADGKIKKFPLADFVLNTDPNYMGKANLPLLNQVYELFLKGNQTEITLTIKKATLAGYVGDVQLDIDKLFEGVALARNEKATQDAPF